MHGLMWCAGLLGLIALAFGTGASVIAARVILLAPLVLIVLVIIDVITRGALSRYL